VPPLLPVRSEALAKARALVASGRELFAWAVLLCATLLALMGAAAQEPPKGLLRQLASNGSRFEKERGQYTYRQSFFFQESGAKGAPDGFYREVREVIFSPEGQRQEQLVGRPTDHLKRIRLTEEDFRDIRDVQPFVLTEDTLWQYEFAYKGREDLEGEDCYVFRMRPRQVLEEQRLLDGLIWVSSKHRQLVKAAGQPVPQIYRGNEENLFPQFATIYRPIDGTFWFPVKTVASDVLSFRTGPQRVRYVIEYENYKRFSAESSITFDTNP
jgi:hypothetical protein